MRSTVLTSAALGLRLVLPVGCVLYVNMIMASACEYAMLLSAIVQQPPLYLMHGF